MKYVKYTEIKDYVLVPRSSYSPMFLWKRNLEKKTQRTCLLTPNNVITTSSIDL